jgi:hypothetical protein
MYSLILTAEERAAFDFVGHRYVTGTLMADLLIECMPPDREWTDRLDMRFDIPEHTAWEIADLAASEQDCWPLFARTLRNKMQAFVDCIV